MKLTDIEIFKEYMKGKTAKQIIKKGVSKTKAYKILKRFNIWNELQEPIMLMVLNLSSTGFRALRENKLKTSISSQRTKSSFSHPPSKLRNKLDAEDDMYD